MPLGETPLQIRRISRPAPATKLSPVWSGQHISWGATLERIHAAHRQALLKELRRHGYSAEQAEDWLDKHSPAWRTSPPLSILTQALNGNLK